MCFKLSNLPMLTKYVLLLIIIIKLFKGITIIISCFRYEFLNFYGTRPDSGALHKKKAITLSVYYSLGYMYIDIK